MPTPQQVMDGMSQKNQLLTSKNTEYTELSEKYASAKRDYNIGYAKKVIELKTAGNPTTIIKELVKGDKIIANLGYQMDVSEGVMKACRESMSDIRAALDSYRSLLTWMRAELQSQ